MIRHVTALLNLAFILTLASLTQAETKREVRLHRIEPPAVTNRTDIRIRPQTASDQIVYVAPFDSAVWRAEGWVTGAELYKTFLDPAKSHDSAYPFVVTEISMPMYFAESTVVIVSVDLEDVFYAADDCPFPDSILAISSDYMVPIPGKGYYNVWVPLDHPVAVNTPFFAGFFIGNVVDSTAFAALLTGEDRSAVCRSYNIWDEQVGFVDLVNNGILDFPGQILMCAAGIPGGGRQAEPEPEISILQPTDGQSLLGNEIVWAHETSGSTIIDYVSFEYSRDGRYVEFARDYDGTSPIRDGTEPATHGDGFAQGWDCTALEEGIYRLRVTAYDTLGRQSSDEVSVYVEPTPPTPKIVSPEDGSGFCSDTDILVTCRDEDLAYVSFYTKAASDSYSAGILPLRQSDYGECYCGPVAAAMAVRLWIDRGLNLNDSPLSTLVTDLATRFRTDKNGGTTDECLYCGLRSFSRDNGSPLDVETHPFPDYASIRVHVEEEEHAVLLALGGSRGVWVAVDGFEGWRQADGTFHVTVCDPVTGARENCLLRDTHRGCELRLAKSWQSVDRLVALRPPDWKIGREVLGTDSDDLDGWSYHWSATSLPENSRHYLRTEAVDNKGIRHANTVIVHRDCSACFTPGDYDGNSSADLVDLVYLIEFVMRNGTPPAGGELRADANGDHSVNVADVVYYMNYLYGIADAPRH